MRSVTIVSVLCASALIAGCAARPAPATAGPPPPAGGNPPPPGYGPPPPSSTYNIGGYAVSKRFFWLGLAAATLGTGAFLDNVPGSAKDGDLQASDFFPAGLYIFGGSFFIAGMAK
jgi:hypothetical protein